MKQQTKNKALLWTVWILALALLLITGLAVSLQCCDSPQEPEAVDRQPPETKAAESETKAAEWETEPTQSAPTLELEENPYGPEDFDFRGRYLECAAGPCRIGVDVSAWQEEVNWSLVKAGGMEFAMIRLAWRGSSEGNLSEDRLARDNYQGARDAGLAVGGYLFSQALTPEEAVEEAEFVLEMVKDWSLELPIVFDWEQTGGRTANMDSRTLTDCALAFCQTIEAAGYEAMVYFNPYQAYRGICLEELTEYGFWLAMYESDMTFPYKVDMWQYSCTGSVPGITGEVDLNIWFDYE